MPGIGFLREPVSQFIDFHIRSLVTQLGSYVQKTIGLLGKSVGATDVMSLHTNVAHKEEFEALYCYLNDREQ